MFQGSETDRTTFRATPNVSPATQSISARSRHRAVCKFGKLTEWLVEIYKFHFFVNFTAGRLYPDFLRGGSYTCSRWFALHAARRAAINNGRIMRRPQNNGLGLFAENWNHAGPSVAGVNPRGLTSPNPKEPAQCVHLFARCITSYLA
jgi:hypothetical protein